MPRGRNRSRRSRDAPKSVPSRDPIFFGSRSGSAAPRQFLQADSGKLLRRGGPSGLDRWELPGLVRRNFTANLKGHGPFQRAPSTLHHAWSGSYVRSYRRSRCSYFLSRNVQKLDAEKPVDGAFRSAAKSSQREGAPYLPSFGRCGSLPSL